MSASMENIPLKLTKYSVSGGNILVSSFLHFRPNFCPFRAVPDLFLVILTVPEATVGSVLRDSTPNLEQQAI